MLYIYSEKSELRAEEIIGLLSKNVSKRPWFGTPETVFEGDMTKCCGRTDLRKKLEKQFFQFRGAVDGTITEIRLLI